MGAGTTDIAVFEYDMSNPTNFSHICSWPKTNGVTFGGGEIDGILCDFYKRKLGKEITSMIGKGNSALGEMLLRSQVKKYKEDVLSKLEEGEETTYLPGSLDYMPNAEDAYLDRALFEDLLKEYLSKFPKLVNGALKEAEMTSEQVDMVLLTGGHSQWYFVKKMLIEQGISGNSIFDFSDPHLVVAKGAALYVEKERKVKKPLYQEQKSSVSVVEENKIDLIHEAISIRKGIIDISKIFANPFRINDATKTLKMEYDPKNILRPVIASGKECIAAVDKNGRVWIAGRSSFEKAKVYEWKNIVSVAVGRSFILGLASDGSVKKVDDGIFQIDVSKWKNIISIVACDNAAFGLKNDGTVVYAGRSRRINRIVSTWDSITSIAISRNDGTVWGVKSDGKLLKCESMFQTDSGVYYIPNVMMVRSQNLVNRVVLERSGKVKCDEQYIPNWTNIVAIDHWSHTVGLKADGTVVAYGTENNGKLNVSHWCEMIAVAVGLYWTIGLRADGTVSVAYKPDSLTHPLPYEEIRRWKLF